MGFLGEPRRNGELFKKTLRLVEGSMLASVAGLAYLLSNSLAIEKGASGEEIASLYITINIHASLTYILMAIGVNTIPTMDAIYSVFGSL